jgi:hypothetical protein
MHRQAVEFPDTDRHNRDDGESFVLPVQGLFADVETGAGCLRLGDELASASARNRLSILLAWQRDLSTCIDGARAELLPRGPEASPSTASPALATLRAVPASAHASAHELRETHTCGET